MGRLRFKSKSRFKTFTYNQTGFKIINNGKRCQTLWLSKIGNVPIRCHRNIKGEIKSITIKKTQSNKWFASISTELKVTVPKKKIKNAVGIDLGLTNLVYDSEGNKIINPRHIKVKEKKLKYLQNVMSKKTKGSNNRRKARIRLARHYDKLVNSRKDFIHKLSRYYVTNYDAIGFEDFDISAFSKSNKYAKHMNDASWGMLRQFVAYKVESTGKHYITVDYKGTTQRCSKCGNIVKKDLKERMHKCPYCGFTADRDYNSALEIKKLMLNKIEIGQGLSESKLVETEALPFQRQLRSGKQEAISSTPKVLGYE